MSKLETLIEETLDTMTNFFLEEGTTYLEALGAIEIMKNFIVKVYEDDEGQTNINIQTIN